MLRRWAKLLLSLAIIAAAIRMAVVVSRYESGWEFVLTQWQDATLSVFGLGHTPIGHRDPTDQAQFWLTESDRIVDEHSQSAAIHMGAAWILDSPDIGFLENYVRQSEFAHAFPQMGLELDEDAISHAKSKFRDHCLDRCLEYAAKATSLAPDDVRWWRMRALLLFEGDTLYSGKDFEPRTNTWLEILDECKKYDPDNALYDYLAALRLWNESASYDWPIEDESSSGGEEWVGEANESNGDDDTQSDTDIENEHWVLTIADADGFTLGTQRFLDAQKKPYLAIGENGYPAIAEFLSHSRVRKLDQAEVAVSRLVTFRHSTLFHRIWRWQNVRADTAKLENDVEQEAVLLQQCLRLYDQAIAPQETSALNTLATFGILRQTTYESIERLVKNDERLINPAQGDKIQQREEELRVATATLQSALQELDGENYPKEYSASWFAVFSTITSTSTGILFSIAVVSLLVAKVLSRQTDSFPEFGFLRHVVTWAIGCGCTFIVLGMAPAELISHDVQRLAIISGVWGLAISITGLAVWFVIRLLQLRKLRFRLITMFSVMTGVAVLASLWPLMEASFEGISEYPPELWLHAKGWSGIDAEVLRTAMKLEKGSWYWAMIQWFAHGGLYVGLGISVLLTLLWYMWRCARKADQRLPSYWTQQIRPRWSELLQFLGTTSFIAALGWMFLYLLVAPTAVQLVDSEFQHKMRYCRAPTEHWTEIRDAQADVEASAGEMKLVRDQVEFELFGDAVLEQDFGEQ